MRGGYGLVYDRIGAGLASTFDNGGSFGLSNNLDSPFGGNNETSPDVRFTGIDDIPATYPDAPPAGFPATPTTGAGAITSGIDQSIRTPYSHVFNVIVGKDLGKSYGLEVGYVGRRGRNLLVRRDIAMPLNLTDPASGVDYFTAARQLIDAYNAAGGDVGQMGRIPYWENMFPDAAFDGFTATQNMAAEFGGVNPDYITALYNADQFCFPACSRFGPFAFFAEQYDSLAAQSSIARSEYDAMQLTLRRRFTDGYQFDLNYTLARGKDHGSQVERGSAFDNFGSGGYSGFLVNSFEPDLNYSLLGLRRAAPDQRQLAGGAAVRPGQALGRRRRDGDQRDHRRLVGRRHRPVVERLPVQRDQLPLVLGDELEPAGQRRARRAGRAARDARRRATRSAASRARSPIRRRRSRRSATCTRAKPASATCCAATATSPST